MRRQIAAMASAAGVPDEVFEGLYIVEIIEASHAWLIEQPSVDAPPLPTDTRQPAISAFTTLRWKQQKVRVFDDARRVLMQLRSAGYKLGIVTRNCREAVTMMFPDMNQYIDCLHARDDVAHLKPDPRHLQANLDVCKSIPPHR